MTHLRVHLANCPIGGQKFSVGSDGIHRRNVIELKLSGTQLRIRQTNEGMTLPRSKLSGRTVHTTTIEFDNVPPHRRHSLERIADDIACLLALATVSPVVPFQYEYGALGRSIPVSRKMTYFRPLIDRADGAAVSSFLKTTWTQYRRLKLRRKLPAVIDYIVHAQHPDQPIEVQVLLAFTALDSLKWTWCHQQFNFRKHVEAMFKDVGMKRGLKRLIEVRNRIVHRGLAGIPYSTLTNHNDRLHDMVREYLLRLLDYHGPFARYSSRTLLGHLPRKRRR